MNKFRKMILIILLIAGFGLLALGIYQANSVKSKKENNNISPTEEPSDTNTIEYQSDIPRGDFYGLYYLGIEPMYIYQSNNQEFFFAKNSEIYGKATVNGNKAHGERISGTTYKYTFTINDGILDVQTDDPGVQSGQYTKLKDIIIEEFYEIVPSDSDLFKTE